MPITAINNPAIAGPSMRADWNAVELSATALDRLAPESEREDAEPECQRAPQRLRDQQHATSVEVVGDVAGEPLLCE